jgi:hypothetical protein
MTVQAQVPYKPLESYLNSYTSPMAKALTYGMSGGWYTTAETHKLFGVDLSFSGSIVPIPTEATMFSSKELSLGGFSITQNGVETTVPNLPTIAGGTAPDGVELSYSLSDNVKADFPVFDGIDLPGAGAVAIQLGFGLPKGTDIRARFLPNMSNIADEITKFSMWGVGIQHDVKQWIPVISHVPFLQMSLAVNYSQFNFNVEEVVSMTNETFDADLAKTLSPSVFDGQYFGMKVHNFNTDFLVGASLPIFQPYVGLGYTYGKFNAGLYGNYPEVSINTESTLSRPLIVNKTIKDPIELSEKINDIHVVAGARLKLAVIVLHYQYTYQEYPMHTAGIGFTFR